MQKDLIESQGYDNVTDLSYLQWAYRNNEGTEYYSINSPNWNTTGGTNVSTDDAPVVAVIDSGIDYTHPDLKDVMADMTPYIEKGLKGGRYGYNPTDPENEDDPMDINGHGTHCAGIIAAAWDGHGTSGVASGAKLLAVASSINESFSTANIIKSFIYLSEACDLGLNLRSVNCSFGGEGSTNAERLMTTELGKKGVITCYASGNASLDNDQNIYSSSTMVSSPYVIVVNSTNPSYKLSDFTCYGKNTTSLFAPGEAILSPVCNDAAHYFPSVDTQRVVYDTFTPGEDDSEKVKFMYLGVKTTTGDYTWSLSKDEFENIINNWEEAGSAVSSGESFDNDGYSYEINAPKLANKNERAIYLASVPVSEEEAKNISNFGVAEKSTLSQSCVRVKPVKLNYDKTQAELEVSGQDGWGRPSDTWCNSNVSTAEATTYAYYNGRLYFTVVLSDYGSTYADSKFYIDCVGGGTDTLRYAFYQGTSMATPAVTGSCAIMFDKLANEEPGFSDLTPAEQAAEVAAAINGSTEYNLNYDSFCKSNGTLNFNVSKENYTPYISSMKLAADGSLTVNGKYFGTDPGEISLAGTVFTEDMGTLISWSDTEIKADVSSNKLINGTKELTVKAANGKKTSRTMIANGFSGREEFEGKVTLPDEIKDNLIESMCGLSGKIYLAPQINAADSDYPTIVKSIWEYDRENDNWKESSEIPLPDVINNMTNIATELTTYEEFVVVHVSGNSKADSLDTDNITYLDKVYFYDPSKDTWTEADFGDLKIPYSCKLFGTEKGLFIAGGEVESKPEEDIVVNPTEANETIYKMEFSAAPIVMGEETVKIKELKEAGSSPINTYATIQSYKNDAVFLSKDTAWLTWSDDENKFTVTGKYEFDESMAFVGDKGEKAFYSVSFTNGAVTPLGVIFAGMSGNKYYGRGFDTFYLNKDGTMTDFGKYASFEDLYLSRACYTDDYLYVWGNSYYSGDDVVGYLTYTKLDVPADETVEEIVSDMTLDEKISQMIIPAIRTWQAEGAEKAQNVTELSNAEGLAETLRAHQYGGIILFGSNVAGTEQVTRLVSDLQKNNALIEASANIPYFMPVDEEGGVVTRLSSGTRMTGSMAVGATGDNAESNALLTGTVIGEELKAIGFNVDFAPDIDVNSNAANPVIGTRSFSDDPEVVSKLGYAFNEGLKESNIIGTYKHFPGHGDSDTDSHIGTATVNKTLEQLKQTEFVPFKAVIDAGADLIMTAHVTLPLVDDEVTFADGTKGYYPATMSKKIMSGILRGDLGFDGVIVTDALEMNAIAEAKLVEGEEGSAEYHANVAEKVINAGVDILLLPMDLTSPEKAVFYDDYIDELEAKVYDEEISEDEIDTSVTRILKLKEKYGILDMDTSGDNIEETVENAKKIVGSDAHHESEMSIANQAITMVKNDAQTLPVTDSEHNIVLIGRNKADTISIGSAIKLMKMEGLIAEDTFVNDLAGGTQTGSADSKTRITVDYYFDSSSKPVHYTDELKEAVAAADRVAAVSVSWGISDISPNAVQYQAISALINDTHSAGGKFILISSNLPYDSARYQNADAILLTYMSSGTGLDPTERDADANAGAYNANILAAINIAFAGGSPSGTLPVSIPAIEQKEDGTIGYTDKILYARGFGLTYENTITVKAAGGTSIAFPKTANASVAAGKLLTVSGAKGSVTYSIASVNKNSGSFTIDANTGNITVKKGTAAGTYTLNITVKASGEGVYAEGSRTVATKITINKIKNTIKVKPASKKLSYKKLSKKALSFKLTATAGEKARVSYKRASVTKKAKKYITVTSAGKVKVKKGLKKGTYTLKVKATSKATADYKKTTVTKTIKIRVK